MTQKPRKPRVFFTSDTHYDHENVIRYSNRPYRDKHEMTDALIAKWNAVVLPEDTVYHLGDVFFCQEDRALDILAQLSGTKHLILGNHDKLVRSSAKVQSHFSSIQDLLEVNTPTPKAQSACGWGILKSNFKRHPAG